MFGSIVANEYESFPDRLMGYVGGLGLIILIMRDLFVLIFYDGVLISIFLLANNSDLFRVGRVVVSSLRPRHG